MDFQPSTTSSADAPALNADASVATKSCGSCKQLLPRSEFNWKDQAKGRLQSKCRCCTKAYGKQHYQANTDTYVEKAARNKAPAVLRNRVHVDDALADQTCRICDGTEALTHYQGKGATTQPVHQAVYMGLSLKSVQDAMDRSQVVCQACLQTQFGEGLAPWQRLTHAERQALRAQREADGMPRQPKDVFKKYKRVAGS